MSTTPTRSNVTRDVKNSSRQSESPSDGRKREKIESRNRSINDIAGSTSPGQQHQRRTSYHRANSSPLSGFASNEKLHHDENTPLSSLLPPLPRSQQQQKTPPRRNTSNSRLGATPSPKSTGTSTRSPMSSSKSPNGSRNIRNSGLHVPDILSESNRSTSGGSIRSIGNNGHRHHRRTRRGRHRSSFTESQNRPTSFTEGAKRAFSLILGTDDSEEDEDSRSNNHYHDGRLMLTARWTGKWKRRLILLTVISVLLTLLSRSIYNGNNSDGGSTASATTNGVHSTNGNDDVTTTEFDNVKQSCR
eukprot:4893996-Ditylum_brightwellii.AAC.1